jgi:hypothetical protein
LSQLLLDFDLAKGLSIDSSKSKWVNLAANKRNCQTCGIM